MTLESINNEIENRVAAHPKFISVLLNVLDKVYWPGECIFDSNEYRYVELKLRAHRLLKRVDRDYERGLSFLMRPDSNNSILNETINKAIEIRKEMAKCDCYECSKFPSRKTIRKII